MNNINQVSDIFNQLANTPGKIDKENILKQHQENFLFRDCLKFLLDPYITTGISKSKLNKKLNLRLNTYECENIRDLMDYIQRNNTGKDSDIIVVQKFIRNNEELKDFIFGLMTKTTKLGLTSKTANKVFKGLIREFNVMLAESYDKNINKVKGNDFILTLKLDGTRLISIVEDGNISFYSRQGQQVEGLLEIESAMQHLPNGVYDGELIAIGEFSDSKEQFSETMKRSRLKGNKSGLKFVCYDYIENIDDFYKGIDKTPCIDRKRRLQSIIENDNNARIYIEYLYPMYCGNEMHMIDEYSKLVTEQGQEGIMLSLSNAHYSCKRSKDLLKVKLFKEADVRVLDIIEGDGKNKGKLGAITIQFEHNNQLHSCNCGSGFNDNERELYFNNPELLLNKIVTIGYFEITQNESTKEYGFRFPTWKGIIRDDKDEISMH